MVPQWDRHSRLVFWLKILLPMAALAILSTMFLVSRTIVTDPTIPFANVDVNDLARDQRLTAPEYSAVTSDGASVVVTAVTARPAKGKTDPNAEGVMARFTQNGTASIDISAPLARFDAPGGQLFLSGGVHVSTSDGYQLDAATVDAALNRTDILASGAVTAIAPMGKIESDEAHLTAAPDGSGRDVLVFNKGVRLVYQPKP